jgi:CheY-like chemotaxis protein
MSKILVMEDDALQRENIVRILEEHDYDVVAVPTATEAFALATAETFDLLITDIIVRVAGRSSPDGGISLIGRMRRVNQTNATPRTVPILAVSGTYKNPGMENILVTARHIGATEEMRKPIRAEGLLSMVDRLLSGVYNVSTP